jgi:magnesium-transporting ATPase (P-type)
VLLGTSIVSGTAVALVIATGPETAFGDIAARLGARSPETEFERDVRHFALLIMRTVVFLVLFVVVGGAALHHRPFEMLLFAMALAVGLTPEFLPMITTVTLTQGAVRMARSNVIVKHLAAIEDFGSLDILCSDKTGTLTTGEMVLDEVLDPRFGDPRAPRARHGSPSQARRDPVRLRAPARVGRRRGAARALAHLEGRAGEPARLLHPLRIGPRDRVARCVGPGAMPGRPRRPQRARLTRPRGHVPRGTGAGHVHRRG